MSKKNKLIGKLLREAHLIDESKLKVALMEQKIYPELKVGEILYNHGWLKKKTADFFGKEIKILIEKEKLLIGQYLYRAGLVSKKDIQNILNEQKQLGVKFGSVAVLKGFIKQETLDFFLEHFDLLSINKNNIQSKKRIILDQQSIIDVRSQKRQTNQKDNYSFNTILKDFKPDKKSITDSENEEDQKPDILVDDDGFIDIPWID